jgi:hypothetical protein
MDLETVFAVCNYGVLPFWALLVLAPRARLTALLVHRPVVPAVLGVLYAVLLFSGPEPPEGASMTTLAGVTTLFSEPSVVMAGWLHYLIFDLFVGAWESRDALRRGIPHWLVAPCLVLTLMLGPVGLLAYLALRFARVRVLGLEEMGG